MNSRTKLFAGIFLVLFTLTSIQSTGQIIIALLFGEKLNSGNLEFGLTTGPSLTGISNYANTKSKAGLGLGLYFNIKLSDRWYLHPEAIPKYPTGVKNFPFYSLGDQVLDSLFRTAEITRKIKNITVPLLVRYRVYQQFFLEAGPQIGLRTKAKDEFDAGDLTYEKNIEEQITRFDAGMVFGMNQRFSSKISSLSMGIRYYVGLTDIDKLTEGSQQNGVWQLLISIPVGATKEKKNNIEQ